MYLVIRSMPDRDDGPNGIRAAGDVLSVLPDDWLDVPNAAGQQRDFGREGEKRCLIIRCSDIPSAAAEAILDNHFHETELDPEDKPGFTRRLGFRGLRFRRTWLEQINLGSLASAIATAYTPGAALPRDAGGKPIVPSVQWVELRKALLHKGRGRRAVDPDDLVPERVRIEARRQQFEADTAGMRFSVPFPDPEMLPIYSPQKLWTMVRSFGERSRERAAYLWWVFRRGEFGASERALVVTPLVGVE